MGVKVSVTDVNGTLRELEATTPGQSLMSLARQAKVAGIFGDCGGGCACATCHVYVDQAWWDRVGAPDDIEYAMLDMVTDVLRDNSRLSCQIALTDMLDGLSVTVAPAA